MKGDPCDVAIAGGGPAGTNLALELSSKGILVRLFEEHASLGSPAHCAGLVGSTMADLPTIGRLVRKCTVNKVRGAIFISPSGTRFTVEGGAGSALVLDRKLFDRRLGELAVSSGTNIHLRSKVMEVGNGIIRVLNQGSEEQFRPEVVVGATGAKFSIASLFGDRTGSVIPGVQLEIANLDLDEEMVHLYFGKNISDGLFGWVIPLDSSTARVGLCSRSHAKDRLNKFVDTKVKEDFGRGKIIEINAGSIVYGIRERTVWGNTILVGDEALQTKPATGGGIHYSIICAKIASRSIVSHLKEGKDLSNYEAAWRKNLEKEIRFGLWARRFYEKLSDEELDQLFAAISDRVAGLLAQANFDKHSTVGDLLIDFLPRIIKDLGAVRVLRLAKKILV